MKHLLLVLTLALAAGVSHARSAHATAPAASQAAAAADSAATQPGTPQRNKMKTCNAEARTKDVHGADRRAFMKQCLSSGKAKTAAAS